MRSLITIPIAAVGLLLSLAFVVSGPGAQPPGVATSADPSAVTPTQAASTVATNALAIAATQLGVPYQFGVATPGVGFDCSGLIWWAYHQAGLDIPRVTFDQARAGVAVELSDLEPGDLIFTRGGAPPRDLGHVSLYAGGGEVLTAPSTGAVVTYRRLDLGAVQAVRRVAATSTQR